MAMDLIDTMHISASGMRAQSERLKIVSQNLANAESVGTKSGGTPYRRQTISFATALDKESGVEMVQPGKVGTDRSDFQKKYEPTNPAADDKGYVLYPNVNPISEMMDMREARRAYEANLDVIQASKSMVASTVNLLK